MNISISLLNHDPQIVEFNELLRRNEKTIIYFYPKDNTPGCTIEAKDFSDEYTTFLKQGIWVYGISKDAEGSHCNFISKHHLSIPLISDPELVLHKKFGARGEKNNYGKIYEWTIRSTFLLDQEGNIIKARKNVKAAGHVKKIMEELEIK